MRCTMLGFAALLLTVVSFAADEKMKPKLIDPVAVVSVSLEKVDVTRARTFYVDALLRARFVVREHTQELAHMLPPGTIKIASKAHGVHVSVDNLSTPTILKAIVYAEDSSGRAIADDHSGKAAEVATMLYTEAKKQFGDAVSIRWRNARDSGL